MKNGRINERNIGSHKLDGVISRFSSTIEKQQSFYNELKALLVKYNAELTIEDFGRNWQSAVGFRSLRKWLITVCGFVSGCEALALSGRAACTKPLLAVVPFSN